VDEGPVAAEYYLRSDLRHGFSRMVLVPEEVVAATRAQGSREVAPGRAKLPFAAARRVEHCEVCAEKKTKH